jgi:hypothetical protein
LLQIDRVPEHRDAAGSDVLPGIDPMAIKWSGGKWTTAVSRKRTPGSKTGVQFVNLDGTYEFGVAAFDNAQVRHAFHVGALKLKFAK